MNLHQPRSLFVWAALLASGASACVANSEPQGGETLFDASAPVAASGPPLSTNTARTFTSLYDDYVGPKGKASCSSEGGACHGGPSEPGAQASGFVCTDKATCFTTLTQASGLVKAGTAPAQTGFVAILRKPTGGRMPKRPDSIVFQTSDLRRITDWIAAGAPND